MIGISAKESTCSGDTAIHSQYETETTQHMQDSLVRSIFTTTELRALGLCLAKTEYKESAQDMVINN